MRIRLLTISERQPAWVNDGYAEYAKRLPRHLAPELVELPLAKRGKGGDAAKHKADESERLLAIGGPDGHAPVLLERAAARWSLSPLTLPHGLVRVVIAEQLYRAHSILEGHPYHRA